MEPNAQQPVGNPGNSGPTEPSGLERRANDRLATDLARFQRAMERLEQHGPSDATPRHALPSPAATMPAATMIDPQDDRNLDDYLECLDHCFRQLDESREAIAAILPPRKPRSRRLEARG